MISRNYNALSPNLDVHMHWWGKYKAYLYLYHGITHISQDAWIIHPPPEIARLCQILCNTGSESQWNQDKSPSNTWTGRKAILYPHTAIVKFILKMITIARISHCRYSEYIAWVYICLIDKCEPHIYITKPQKSYINVGRSCHIYTSLLPYCHK